MQSMNQLSKTYSQYQAAILATHPKYVNYKKAAKLSSKAESQLEKMRKKNDFTNYEEAKFYKQKFQKLSKVASKLEQKKISDENYHKMVREIVNENFVSSLQSDLKINDQINGFKSKSKSPLKLFFEEEQIKRSKTLNFSNVLEQLQTPLKFDLRTVSRLKIPTPAHKKQNLEELHQLQQENRRLKQRLNKERSQNTIESSRLRQLKIKINELNEQNKKLKTEVSKSQTSDFVLEQYDPYNIKIRENNIIKILNKSLAANEKNSQLGAFSDDFNEKKSALIHYERQSEFAPSEIVVQRSALVKNTGQYFKDQMLNSSQSTVQTQILNLEDSELYNSDKNELCRQKIAFFKKSMILVKTSDFDVAYKRSEFNFQMDKLRLILYVNNKSKTIYSCSIEYDYDKDYFDLTVKKKLSSVEKKNQARQQLEVILKKTFDLGSIITAKILIGDKMKKVVVPALFIDFDSDYKYQFDNIEYIQRNLSQPLLIRPMSQYSTINQASSVLDIVRQYEQKYQMGKLYGKSKACKSIVKLTWKKGKIKIQTCEQWKILMGYLLLNAEESPAH